MRDQFLAGLDSAFLTPSFSVEFRSVPPRLEHSDSVCRIACGQPVSTQKYAAPPPPPAAAVQAAAMADTAFQGDTGAVKAVMKRLQRGSHKRSARTSSSAPNGGRSSSVSKIRAAIEKGKKGACPPVQDDRVPRRAKVCESRTACPLQRKKEASRDLSSKNVLRLMAR